MDSASLSLTVLILRSWRAFRKNRFTALSAQFAYYCFFLLTPALILLLAVAAKLPMHGFRDGLLEIAARALPKAAYDLVALQVDDIQASSTVRLIAIALLAIYYASSGLFRTLSQGLNAAYELSETRPGWKLYGLGALFTLGVFLVITAAGILLVIGPHLTNWLSQFVPVPDLLMLLLRSGVRWVIVAAAMLVSVSLIYWLAPSVRPRWRLLSHGNIFAVGMWLLVCLGFRVYVNNFARYNETYGALGGVIILLVWIKLTGAALFMGAQIDSVIESNRSKLP